MKIESFFKIQRNRLLCTDRLLIDQIVTYYNPEAGRTVVYSWTNNNSRHMHSGYFELSFSAYAGNRYSLNPKASFAIDIPQEAYIQLQGIITNKIMHPSDILTYDMRENRFEIIGLNNARSPMQVYRWRLIQQSETITRAMIEKGEYPCY